MTMLAAEPAIASRTLRVWTVVLNVGRVVAASASEWWRIHFAGARGLPHLILAETPKERRDASGMPQRARARA